MSSNFMLFAVLSGFVTAIVTPWIHTHARRSTGWLLAALPVALMISFLRSVGDVIQDGPLYFGLDWVPSIGFRLAFLIDGWSLLFAILVSGIGALILAYAGEYLHDDRHGGRFLAAILAFMASMLGTVTAGNLLSLFVFWELTSICSYVLIGHHHESRAARAAALQALLVTGVGGLALLAGFLLLGHAAGTFEIPELVTRAADIREHDAYPWILALVVLGACTKSAQFPFHFWLPNAMQAPTPASAYLHAATMVKAGVFLLARLSPVLGGTVLWQTSLPILGALTALVGGFLALHQTSLKRVLAYTTVAALGLLVFLIGLDTPYATRAAVVFVVAHALYKGALFLVAGNIDHGTGEREIDRLGGLARSLPLTCAAAGLAALSMAPLPPLLGFIGKEMLYEASLTAPQRVLWTTAAVLANVAIFIAAYLVGVRPFVGKLKPTPHAPHEVAPSLWIPPALLSALGLLIALFPASIQALLGSAATAIHGEPLKLKLSLWHGWTLALALSGATVVAGAALALWLPGVRRATRSWLKHARWAPENAYNALLEFMLGLAAWQTRLLQNGRLSTYVRTIVVGTVAAAGWALLRAAPPTRVAWSGAAWHEIGIIAVVGVAALTAVTTASRFKAIVALGVVGYGVALVFALYGAPDLALTQLVVETLTVIVFALAFPRLPAFSRRSRARSRIRDAGLALVAGTVIGGFALVAMQTDFAPTISRWFGEHSVPEAHGHNVVNVILVDFRALDTLGEITVLAVAALGVAALVHRLQRGGTSS